MARNTALRASAEIVGKLASVVLFAFIARGLGTGILGEFVFALAVAQIVWAVAGFGLDRMALRDIAREREAAVDRLFWDITGFKAVAGTAGVAVSVALVVALDYSGREQQLIAILGASFVVVLMSSSAQTVFQAYERMEYFFYAAVPNKILAAVLGIAVLALGGGIVAVAVSNLVAAVAGLVLAMAIMYRRFARPTAKVTPRRWPQLLRRSGPFGLQEVFGQIIFRLDIVLLSLITTSAIVGQYGAGYRLIEATLFLAWSVGTSVLPMYSYLEPDGELSLYRVFEGSLKFVTVIMMPVSVALFVCARPIVDLLYGLPAYEGAVPVLRWLAFSALAYALGHLAGILVLVRRPGRVTVVAVGAVAVVSTVINLLLIPAYEAQGAAAAALATQVILGGVSLALARSVAGTPRPLWVLGPATVAGAAMAAAMVPFADHLIIALPLGAVAYLLVLAAIESRSLGGDLSALKAVVGRQVPPAVAAQGEGMEP